jgi:nucleoid DNA-binding protein
MNMDRLFYKYLILKGQGSIPGIGTFSVQRQPSQSNYESKTFSPPAVQIDFKHGNAVADKHFYDFVADEKQIDEVEAIRLFSEYAYNLKNEVDENRSISLGDMGVLKQTGSGELFFTNKTAVQYFPPVIAERIIRETIVPLITENYIQNSDDVHPLMNTEIETGTSSKDDWWIYAIIIAILSIAAIVYYYTQN